MTPPPDDDPPPPPKRRRKPPKGLEGFDTGFPEDDESASGPISTTPAATAPPTAAPPAAAPPAPQAAAPPATAPRGAVPPAGAPRKPIWSDTSPTTTPTTSAAPSVIVDPVSSEPSASELTFQPAIAMSAATSTGVASDRVASDSVAGDIDPSTFPVFTPDANAPAFTPTETAGAVASESTPYTAWTPPTSANLDRDEPLSAAYVGTPDADLRDAVGAKPKKTKKPKRARTEPALYDVDDDFDGSRPRSRKMIIVSAVSLVVGLGVAALVFLGRANSAWYYVSCEPDRIVAQQGRSFPPWGESSISGKQWAEIKIPPEAECIPLETESEDELSDQFRTMLVKRATVLLTAKEVTKTGDAKALLEQALLHARSNTDGARNARTEIQRLLGDVVYWGASLKMRDASKALLDAAKEFDSAAQQRPRHVTDAAAWAEYVRKVVGELESGPAGSNQVAFPPTPSATGPREPAPPGVALPVEPDKGSASEAPPATPPDAGLPTGGVLL